jgi:hypothetical protein
LTQFESQLAQTGAAALPPLLSIEEVAYIFDTTTKWVREHSRPVIPSSKISTKGVEVKSHVGVKTSSPAIGHRDEAAQT